MWGGDVKMWGFTMHSNISCYQLKTDYKCNMFYVTFMITTEQKPLADIQMRKESKHTTTENHEITKGDSKKERYRELQNFTKLTENIGDI